MIIYGWRGRELEQDRGEFHCPGCAARRKYKQMRVATYFTLYFIPLFEINHHGDYVQCLTCQSQWNPTVLDDTPGVEDEEELEDAAR